RLAAGQPPADLGGELGCIGAGAAGLGLPGALREQPVDVALDPAAERPPRRHRGIARDRAQTLAGGEPPADFRGERSRIVDPACHGMEQASFPARNFASLRCWVTVLPFCIRRNQSSLESGTTPALRLESPAGARYRGATGFGEDMPD